MTINYNNSSINRLIFIVLIVLLIAIVIVLSTSRSNKNIAIITDVITDSIVSKNIHHTREEYNSSDHILDKFIYSNYSRLLLVAGINENMILTITIIITIINTTRIRRNWSSCYI